MPALSMASLAVTLSFTSSNTPIQSFPDNKKADIEEVKLTDFSDAFAKMLNYNALNCLLNNGAITDSSQLKFHLYHLRNTDQNAPYYNIPDSDSYIYVVFEQETGYMVSNCAKLQWELTIARGVSDFDIEH